MPSGSSKLPRVQGRQKKEAAEHASAPRGPAGTGAGATADLAALVQPGAVFAVWTSDYDASDLYELRMDELSEAGGMVLSYPDPPARATIRCSQAALQAGSGVVFLSQYSAVAGGTEMQDRQLVTATHSPPFLLSRDCLRRLKAGESVLLSVYSGSFSVKLVGSAQTTVRIHEQPVKVPVLHAQDDRETDFSPVDLWVLDHPEWPLLLKLEFGGECELSLFEIQPAKA